MDDLQKPGLLSGGQVSRREVLKKGLVGAAGLTVLPAVVAACNSAAATPTAAPVTAAPVTAAPVTATALAARVNFSSSTVVTLFMSLVACFHHMSILFSLAPL